MQGSQVQNTLLLFLGQFFIKGSGFIKQLVLAYFLGVSSQIDLLLVAQIIPSIISSMIAGGAGEVIVTQKQKGKDYDDRLILIFIFCISILTLLIGLIYLGTIPLFSALLNINEAQMSVFWTISIIIVISKVPSSIVSCLQHLLYAKEKYKYFVFSTLFSEIAGILTVILFIPSYGILAFAYGLLITSLLNAMFFAKAQSLQFNLLLSRRIWTEKKAELVLNFKRTFSLSIQTLMIHSSTFWERVLSYRYLQPGFLSALNYSKNLTQLPKLALLSSILTTTYIEQLNKKSESNEEYLNYSNRMEIILSEISFIFQILSMIFGPLIIMAIFRRGAFDNEATETSFIIYQILTLGFLPGLMTNFLSRTMFIEKEYKKLLVVNIVKFIIEIVLMFSFIHISGYAIPLALVAGNFFVSIALFILLLKKNSNIFNVAKFIKIYSISLFFSITILSINQFLMKYLIHYNLLELTLLYTPIIVVSLVLIYWGIYKRYGYGFELFFKRIRNHKRKN